MPDYLPANYDLPSCLAGDTFPGLNITSITISDAPLSTTLVSARFQLRARSANNPTAAFSADTDDGITIIDAAAWEFSVDPFLITLSPCTYYYDLETIDSSGVTRTYLSGKLEIVRDATR